MPIQMLVKHFTQVGELWQLTQISAPWSHRQLNLMQDFSHLGMFDVSFAAMSDLFRSVHQDRHLDRLAKVIEPDGVLALGAAETVVGISDAFKPYPDRRAVPPEPRQDVTRRRHRHDAQALRAVASAAG